MPSLPSFSNLPSPMALLQQVRCSLRPWGVFLNVNNFNKICSIHCLNRRVMANLSYYQSNYIFVFFVLMIYCLITAPMTLLVVVAAAYGGHRLRMSNCNYTVMGHQLTPGQQIALLNLAATPILFLVGAGAVLFWTLGASCFVIAMHACFYDIDAVEDRDGPGGYRTQHV
ncbi:hypothetical protein KR018_009144 [Drosophila ironensis]|nr:hypothetical protein KR018_009144 [Drosophila ironensis]